jgi:hypothetical protein
VRRLRLTHPDLDFWVDMRVRGFEGRRWLAVADLAGVPEVGTGDTASQALAMALAEIGGDLLGDLERMALAQLREGAP